MPTSLSERLQTVYSMVRKGESVADIGSDHGQLIIALCHFGVISHAYASDNKKAPFQRLETAVKTANFSDKIVVDLADGITHLPTFIDTVVLAGMGGDLIAHILQAEPSKLKLIKTLILAPNSHVPLVRFTLTKMGFRITSEMIVYEKHYYEIVRAERGIAAYNEADIEFGPFLRTTKSEAFRHKYAERLATIDSLLVAKLSPRRRAELLKEKERILAL